jgi:hypothetical protein
MIKRLLEKLNLIKPQKPKLVISVVSNSSSKPDEYKVIMAGSIMVAQGWECSKCKVIRAYNMPTCNCC